MTEPGDQQRPATRRMEAFDPADDSTTSRHPRQEPLSYAEAAPGAYTAPGYREPEPYAGEPAPPGRSSSRTVLLVLIAGLAVLVLALAAFLAFFTNGSSSDDEQAAAQSSASAASSTTSSSTTTSESTTTSSAAPSSATVTYQLTGNGNLIGLTYRGTSGEQVLATAASPWSTRATLKPSSTASVTAIVVSGSVTCSILYDGEPLVTATSRGGPLSCEASIPD